MESDFLNQFDTNSVTGGVTQQFTDQFATLFLVGTIVSSVITILILVLYIFSAVRKYKVQNAIFDIQKTLHEINDREKVANTAASSVQQTPAAATPEVIASE